MHTYIADRRLHGPGPAPGWSKARAGSPGLGPRLQGLCSGHVSALLAIHVYIFYADNENEIIYMIPT